MKKLFLLLSLIAAPAFAGTGYQYMPASYFIGAKTTACTIAATATAPTKVLWSCATHATNRNGIIAEFWFPNSASTTTFDCSVTVRINSTTTTNNVGARCRFEVTTDADNWDANHGEDATAGSVGTAAVLSTANRDITIEPGTFVAYDQGAAANCASVAACVNRHGILLVERGNQADVSNDDAAAMEIEGVAVFWTTP